jgi:hypothetical protein
MHDQRSRLRGRGSSFSLNQSIVEMMLGFEVQVQACQSCHYALLRLNFLENKTIISKITYANLPVGL